MNNIAISPHIFMYALQNQNVERKTAKQIDIKTLQQKEVVENKETTNISELNTNSVTKEIVETSMSVKNEVTDAILKTLDTETLDTETLDTLDAIKGNPFVSSI
jgi:predicted transcriptional regulator